VTRRSGDARGRFESTRGDARRRRRGGGAAAARRRARGAATTRGLARSRVGVRILSIRSVFVSITDDFKDRARVVVASSSSSRSPRSGRLV
jgi:hypothetical protein